MTSIKVYAIWGTLLGALCVWLVGCDKHATPVSAPVPAPIPVPAPVSTPVSAPAPPAAASSAAAAEFLPDAPACEADETDERGKHIYASYGKRAHPDQHLWLTPPCPSGYFPPPYADLPYEFTLGGDETYTGTVSYVDTYYEGALLTFEPDKKDLHLDRSNRFKIGGTYPEHSINTGAGDLFHLPALQGRGLNCWEARATVRIFRIVVNAEENSSAGVYLTEFTAPQVGEFKPCRILKPNGYETPQGARAGHITRDASLKVYKEPAERSAAKVLPAGTDDLLWIFESQGDWVFIKFLGREKYELPPDAQPPAGWVKRSSLDELVRMDSPRKHASGN